MMHGDNARPQFGPFQVISASDLPTPMRTANCVAAGMCIVAAFVAVMLRWVLLGGLEFAHWCVGLEPMLRRLR